MALRKVAAWYAQFPDLNSLALSVSGLEDLQPFDQEAFVEAIFPQFFYLEKNHS
jgi:hypothetical protein